MARRNAGRKWFDPVFGSGTKDVYARTVNPWQTRTGRRNREFSTFANLLGLNTAFDDLHKKDGESPYLRNVRYMGEKQRAQRTQVTSRNGARLLSSIGDVKELKKATDAQTYIDIWEGKAVEFKVDFKNRLVGGQLLLKNIENARGVLRVIIRPDYEDKPLCDAIIDLTKVKNNRYTSHEFRFIQTVKEQHRRGGSAVIRLEIFDDINANTMSSTPVEGRKVRLLASGDGAHRTAMYELPNTDKSLREVPYEWQQEPAIPLFGIITNEWQTMKKGIQVHSKGADYLVFPVKNRAGNVEIWRHNLSNNNVTVVTASVSNNAKAVRFAVMQGYLFYVDGRSPLKQIDLETWAVSTALTKAADIDAPNTTPEDLQAKAGASLIIALRNRIYLSGFEDDPNWVEFSLINSKGAQPQQFNEGFYSPDRSPKDSAISPITALTQLENNLVVFRPDGNSVFSAPTGLEFGKAQQVDTFSHNVGVHSQDDVAEGMGGIWLYNRSEGFRRYAGTNTYFSSIEVDNELRRIPQGSDTFMVAHGNKVRFYFDRENRGKADHSLVYHTPLASQSPWYMDDNTPVKWVIGDQDSDTLFAAHADYPAIYIIDHEDQYTDFDSMIVMEYHTQYKSPTSLMGHVTIRRVQAKLIASYTNSWFIGVDLDHRNEPAVWRKVVRGNENRGDNPEALFGDTADAGSETVNLFMRARCRDFNIRVKTFNYRANTELLLLVAETGGKEPL